jgi:hypothetical protein
MFAGPCMFATGLAETQGKNFNLVLYIIKPVYGLISFSIAFNK